MKSRFGWQILIILVTLSFNACQTLEPFVSDGTPLVSRPGTVAVDVVARRSFLDSEKINPDSYCMHYATRIPLLHSVDAPEGYGLDSRYNLVSRALRQSGSACLKGQKHACDLIKSGAIDWATKSRVIGPRGARGSGTFWNDTLTINMRLLSPLATMLAVAEFNSPMAIDEKEQIKSWFYKMIKKFEHGMRGEGRFEEVKDGTIGATPRKSAHNHAIQSSLAAMSFGAYIGDDRLFRTGLMQWSITLNSMRNDGSLPIETRRGARALFYHGRTLSALMQIGERARLQNIDLYSRRKAGVGSLHLAVKFFLDAVQNPDLVLPYARANRHPGPSKNYRKQDLGGEGTLGWIAPYIARFPFHENAKTLKSLDGTESNLTPQVKATVLRNGGSTEWIGVDAKCFYSTP